MSTLEYILYSVLCSVIITPLTFFTCYKIDMFIQKRKSDKGGI